MAIDPLPGRTRRPTSTARFGSSRRESHDASTFYERFVAPELSGDDTVAPAGAVDVIHTGDARDMAAVADNSVALVVTSPPYFAGKEYEESLGVGGVPATYFDYLGMLRDVFAECTRVLEPGGRIAVNVANLGRRPFRSLAGDVTQILQDDLGLLLRGEVVWWKGRAAGGSCAWGTFQRPANPVLRDVTERIVIASKGRFDRAVKATDREKRGLPSVGTISREEFLEATTDLWELAPESATRVGHPAPFPVELPTRLLHLYTYENDVVLDPFMGSGTTAVAAVHTNRHYIGFESDPAYAEAARRRIAAVEPGSAQPAVRVPAATTRAADPNDPRADAAILAGRQLKEVAALLLAECGFSAVATDVKLRHAGLDVPLQADDGTGRTWLFDLAGAFTTTRSGLRRTDVLWRTLGRAAVVHATQPDAAFAVLTTEVPARGTPGHTALQAALGPRRPVAAVIDLSDPAARDHLIDLARGA